MKHDPISKTDTVGDFIAHYLAEIGVSVMFGVISIHNMPILDAVARQGRIRFVPARGEALVAGMEAAMPPVDRPRRPRILVEWWPKPVIVPGRDSWITDLLDRVGAVNPLGSEAHKSRPLEAGEVVSLAPEAVAISWCGVPEHQLRPANVLRRDGWGDTPAVRHARVAAISEAYLGRPGPRLVQGYQHLRRLADAIAD